MLTSNLKAPALLKDLEYIFYFFYENLCFLKIKIFNLESLKSVIRHSLTRPLFSYNNSIDTYHTVQETLIWSFYWDHAKYYSNRFVNLTIKLQSLETARLNTVTGVRTHAPTLTCIVLKWLLGFRLYTKKLCIIVIKCN